jgi:hypothetical protein
MDVDFEEAEQELDAEYAEEIEETILRGEVVAEDILGNGPFRHFLAERYKIACESLRDLMAANPHDPATISRLQADIRFWQESCDWARQTLDNARIAEDQMREQDQSVMSNLSGETEEVQD